MVVRAIITRLQSDLALYAKAADAARAEATHEQSKPENKYDTRGLEASYLARGQSRQATETRAAIEQFETLALTLREFGPGDAIAVGALVELRSAKERAFYLLGPRAGGTEVKVAGDEIFVLTSQSPLGQQLLGRRAGEWLPLDFGGQRREHQVVSVR